MRHIFGGLYHSQSHGSVKLTIGQFKIFLFFVKDAINEFFFYYNGRAHSTAGYAPREVMESSKDSDFIQKVRDNKIKSRTIKKGKSEKYTIGLKVRIWNNKTLETEKGFIFYHTPTFVKRS